MEFELLHEAENENIDKLFDLYKRDPFKARIVFMSNYNSYETNRIVLYKDGNDLSLVKYKKRFGISKTNRIYNSEKKEFVISYKNGKFVYIMNNKIFALTMQTLYKTNYTNYHLIKDELVKHFSWIRYIEEHGILWNTSFNTIISKKLYSLKKALIHEYKMPSNVAKLFHQKAGVTSYKMKSSFKIHREYLINIESIKENWLTTDFTLFYDTMKMAKVIDKKVNCSWSLRRLKEEHDKWSKEITDVLYLENDRLLNIHDSFKKFAEFSGFHMFKSTKELALEGKVQSHCVAGAGYVNNIDNGTSAIYRVDEYTLEVVRRNGKLLLNQLLGFDNDPAPTELYESVKKILKEYNDIYDTYDPSYELITDGDLDDLEF